MRSRYTLIIIATMLGLISLTGVDAQSNHDSITADNIDQLTQIGTFEGECATFHPDEAVIATTTGLYDLDSGERRVDLTESPVEYAEWVDFSPDGKWVKMGSRIYSVESGDIVLDIGTAQAVVGFSENGNHAYVHGLAYENPAWQEITVETIPDFERFISTSGETRVWRDYTSGNGISTFLSPSMNYWVHVVEGIYDVSTGELLTFHLN